MKYKETRKRESTPIKEIHNYWYNEAINNGEHLDSLVGYSSFENIYEGNGKHCYACGKKSKLHRCHIVPFALGGDERPSNLFLMCEDCHRDNPDTTHPDLFFSYIRHKDYWLDAELKNTCEILNKFINSATTEELERFDSYMSKIESLPVKDWIPDISGECTGSQGRWTTYTKVGVVWKTMTSTPEIKQCHQIMN